MKGETLQRSCTGVTLFDDDGSLSSSSLVIVGEGTTVHTGAAVDVNGMDVVPVDAAVAVIVAVGNCTLVSYYLIENRS